MQTEIKKYRRKERKGENAKRKKDGRKEGKK